MPKKLVAVAPRQAALVDYEDSTLGRTEVKIRVEYASPKHGTEVSVFRGEDPFVADLFDEDWRLFLERKPDVRETENEDRVALGNQWVGVIVEKGGDLEELRVGDRVCGYGGIQETQIVDVANTPFLLKVPDTMPWKSALCFDPAQFALGGIRDGRVRLGDRVAVFGLGAIGAIAAQMAKAAGAAYVAVIDPIDKRRHAAVDAGADTAFNPLHDDVACEELPRGGEDGPPIDPDPGGTTPAGDQYTPKAPPGDVGKPKDVVPGTVAEKVPNTGGPPYLAVGAMALLGVALIAARGVLRQ